MAIAPDIYQSRTQTQEMPLPELQGPAPGAIVADALGDVGQGLEHYAIVKDRQQLVQQRSDRTVAFADMQGRVQQQIQELRANAGPGGAGHVDAVAKLLDDQTHSFMETVKDPRLVTEFKDDIARWRAGAMVQEQGFEIAQRADKQVADHQAYSDLTSNNLRTNPNPADLAVAMDMSEKRIAGYEVPDSAKAKLRLADRERFSRSYLEGLPAEQRLQLLQKGAFNSELDPKTVDLLTGEAETDIRQAAAAARQQANLAKAEARDQVENVARMVHDGIPMPDSDIAGAQALARAHGLDALDYELGTALVRNRVTRETSAYLPTDYEQRLVTLNAAIAKGGANPDPAQVVERDQLEKLRNQRLDQLRDHPVEWLASIGRPLPPIDITDPATMTPDRITQRSRTMRALSAQAGTPLRLLTDAEAAPLSEAIAHGSTNERLGAAIAIGRFGGDAEAVLRQVAGNDEGFKIAARLGTLPARNVAAAAMRDALAGPDNLKANPNIWEKSQGDLVFADTTGTALASLPASYRAGLYETARNIYATRMTRLGQSKWSEDGFKAAIGDAMGGYWQNGRYLGGIADRKGSAVMMPTGMAADEFDKRLARANGTQLARAANGAPVWSGGRAVYSDEIKGLTPVAVGDGIYAFKVGNGFLTLRDGRTPYRLDVRKLPYAQVR